MIDETRLQTLRQELIALRERVAEKKADLDEVEAVSRMANSMLRDTEEADQPQVKVIADLLDIVKRNVTCQLRLRAAYGDPEKM